MSREPHVFTCLTFDEWKLCFSIAFLEVTDAFEGSFGIHRYHSRGEKGPTRDWFELFLRSIRFLALEKDYEFAGLDVQRNGMITTAGEVEPGNAAFVVMLREGGLPNLPLAFQAAIRLAEREIPSLDTEPFRAAMAQVAKDRRAARSQVDHVAEMERERLRDRALEEIGVVRVSGTIH